MGSDEPIKSTGLALGQRILVGFVFAACFPLAVATIYVRGITKQQIEARGQERLERTAGEIAGSMRAFVEGAGRGVEFLAVTPPISGIDRALANGGWDAAESSTLAAWEDRLSRIFVSFLTTHDYVSHLRYLDESGAERVRVDRVNGKAEIVGAEALQDKSAELYYAAVLALGPGERYISPLDLNRERGAIQLPLQPVLRIAVPLFNSSGGRRGLVIANIDGDAVMAPARHMVTPRASVRVVDEAGNILFSPEPSELFGRELGHETVYGDLNPEAWNASRESPRSAALMIGESAIGWAALRPNPRDQGRVWQVYYEVDQSLISGPVASFEGQLARGLVLVALLALALGFFAYRRWLLRPMVEIRRMVDGLTAGSEIEAGEAPSAGGDFEPLRSAIHRLGANVETRLSELTNWRRLTEEANSGLLFTEVCDRIFESFRTELPYERLGVAILEPGSRTLTAAWARSTSGELKLDVGFRAPLAGSSLERVLETGRPRILNDLPKYLLEKPESESTRLIVEEGWRSSLTCPLTAGGRHVGFVFFSSRELNAYREQHTASFQLVASQLAMIVEKSKLYEDLVELNETKNRVLGAAAHDLRNPLGVLSGYARLMRSEMYGRMPDDAKSALARMDRTCDRMVSLIDDLLDVSAIEAGHLELELEDVALVQSLTEVHQNQSLLAAAKDIQLVVKIPDDLPLVVVDANRLSQVLTNLLSNAFKFSGSGTTVLLSARVHADTVEISVQDEGPGISEADQSRIFEGFVKGPNEATAGESRTGLGLAIAKRIVEAHGGEISVESRLGEGATFRFTILRSQPAAGPSLQMSEVTTH